MTTKRPWTEREDAIVLAAVTTSSEQPFTRWSDLAPQQLPGRVGKQIRERWKNRLNPNINHRPFSREDDLLLWDGITQRGKRWVELSTTVFQSTRSENQLKNRWYSASFTKFIATEFGPTAYAGPATARRNSSTTSQARLHAKAVLFALSNVSAKDIKAAKKKKKKDAEEIAKKKMHKNDENDDDSDGDATDEENEETEKEKNKTVEVETKASSNDRAGDSTTAAAAAACESPSNTNDNNKKDSRAVISQKSRERRSEVLAAKSAGTVRAATAATTAQAPSSSAANGEGRNDDATTSSSTNNKTRKTSLNRWDGGRRLSQEELQLIGHENRRLSKEELQHIGHSEAMHRAVVRIGTTKNSHPILLAMRKNLLASMLWVHYNMYVNSNKCTKATMLTLLHDEIRKQGTPFVVERNGEEEDATGPDGNSVRVDTTAQLVDTPKTLSILWKEWMVGVGRNKPALNFTPPERNNQQNKNKYLKRKPFWLLLGRMVNAGLTAEAACERVFEVYTLVAGATNISAILEAIRKDKQNDVHRPGLSVLTNGKDPASSVNPTVQEQWKATSSVALNQKKKRKKNPDAIDTADDKLRDPMRSSGDYVDDEDDNDQHHYYNHDNDDSNNTVWSKHERLALYTGLNHAMKAIANVIAVSGKNKNNRTFENIKAYAKNNYVELMKEFDNNENVSGDNNNNDDEKERYMGKKWTKKEIAIVRKRIKQYGKNWEQRGSQALAIAALLNNRTAEDVLRFIQNNFASICHEAQENRKRNGNEKLPSPKKHKSFHPSRNISNEKNDSVKQVQKKKNPDYRYHFGPNPGVQHLPPNTQQHRQFQYYQQQQDYHYRHLHQSHLHLHPHMYQHPQQYQYHHQYYQQQNQKTPLQSSTMPTAVTTSTNTNNNRMPSTSNAAISNRNLSSKSIPTQLKLPRSAFICFTDSKKREVAKKNETSKTKNDTLDTFAQAWKQLSRAERAYWDEAARKDAVRYDQEKAAYNGPWTIQKRRAKKDPGAPKRPMSAFLKFSKLRRKNVKEENPNVDNTDVSRLLSEMWRNASEVEKAPYIEAELKERNKYNDEMACFRYQQASNQKVGLKDGSSISCTSAAATTTTVIAQQHETEVPTKTDSNNMTLAEAIAAAEENARPNADAEKNGEYKDHVWV